MKIFNNWLLESINKKYNFNVLTTLNNIEKIVNVKNNEIPSLIDDIYQGKKNASDLYFMKYENDLINLEMISAQITSSEDEKLANRINDDILKFEEMRKAYKKFEMSIQKILNTVKIHDSISSAIKKLSELSQTAHYYSLKEFGYTKKFFKSYSEEQLYEQISKYGNSIVLKGVSDLYISFKNNNVTNIHF